MRGTSTKQLAILHSAIVSIKSDSIAFCDATMTSLFVLRTNKLENAVHKPVVTLDAALADNEDPQFLPAQRPVHALAPDLCE